MLTHSQVSLLGVWVSTPRPGMVETSPSSTLSWALSQRWPVVTDVRKVAAEASHYNQFYLLVFISLKHLNQTIQSLLIKFFDESMILKESSVSD